MSVAAMNNHCLNMTEGFIAILLVTEVSLLFLNIFDVCVDILATIFILSIVISIF